MPTTLYKDTLTVCFFPNFQPFIGLDDKGNWSGWDYDYLKAFAKDQGFKNFVPIPWTPFDGIWKQPGNGICDIAAAGISDLQVRRAESEPTGIWTDHYYHVLRAFAIKKGNSLTKVQDLVGKKAIVTKSSTADIDLRNRLGCAKIDPAPIVVSTDDENEAIKEVQTGKAFAYGGGLGSIETLIAPFHGELVVADWSHCQLIDGCQDPQPEPFSFVVRTADAGLAEALDAFINRSPGGAAWYPGNGGKPTKAECPNN